MLTSEERKDGFKKAIKKIEKILNEFKILDIKYWL